MAVDIRRQDNGVIIVEPHGRIVGENVSALQDALLPEVKAFDVPRILINLEHTTGMSSSGLGVLIQALYDRQGETRTYGGYPCRQTHQEPVDRQPINVPL